MTVNEISDEGTKALSDALKVNTTVTSLNLKCEEERKRKEKNIGIMIEWQGMKLELKEQKQ